MKSNIHLETESIAPVKEKKEHKKEGEQKEEEISQMTFADYGENK